MKFELPKNLQISNKSVGSIISISTIIGIATSMFSYFKFENLDITYRIIILLSIFLLITIIDIIILYVRDREHQYKYSCLNFIIDNVAKNLDLLKKEFSDIKKENDDINKQIKLLNQRINSET